MLRIEIEGGVQRTIEYSVTSEVPLAAVLAHVERVPRVLTPVLPRSTVAVAWDESDSAQKRMEILLEMPPGIRTITYQGREGDVNHRLMFPWTYFLFTLSTANSDRNTEWMIGTHRVYWSQRRITNLQEGRLMPARMANIYEDGRICFGGTAPDASLPLADRLDTIVNQFYASNFNRDLTLRYPGDYRNFAAWAAASAATPTAWQNWDNWVNEAQPVSDILSPELYNAPPIVVNGVIPSYTPGLTFGASEEWLRRLSPNDRIRLRVSLTNLAEDHPELMTPVAEPVVTDEQD